MPLASWIVATHFRADYLRLVLAHLHSARCPKGWEYEIVVGHREDDERARIVSRELGCLTAATSSNAPGGKRNAAFEMSKGELVMTCDDDDFQSQDRPRRAIEAYEAGHGMSGIREYRRLHLPSGQVTRWCGRGGFRGMDLPPIFCTMARNYRREILEHVRGWSNKLMVMEETDLHTRIFQRCRPEPGSTELEADLGPSMSDETIFLQHDKNLVPDRPAIGKGKVERVGPYMVVGEGHWTEASKFPRIVAQRLGLAG